MIACQIETFESAVMSRGYASKYVIYSHCVTGGLNKGTNKNGSYRTVPIEKIEKQVDEINIY